MTAQTTSPNALTILLVEDHEPTITHYQRAIGEDHGITLLTAKTTQNAKNILKDQSVNIVILDNKLKDGAGGGPEVAAFIVQKLWPKNTFSSPLVVEADSLGVGGWALGATATYRKEDLISLLMEKNVAAWAQDILKKGPGSVAEEGFEEPFSSQRIQKRPEFMAKSFWKEISPYNM